MWGRGIVGAAVRQKGSDLAYPGMQPTLFTRRRARMLARVLGYIPLLILAMAAPPAVFASLGEVAS